MGFTYPDCRGRGINKSEHRKKGDGPSLVREQNREAIPSPESGAKSREAQGPGPERHCGTAAAASTLKGRQGT